MKSILTLILTLGISLSLFGQISINNSTFPSVGTTLSYYSTSNTNNVSPGPAGENRTWDFSNLTGGQPYTEKYRNVSEGRFKDSFPDANILLLDSRQTDGEQYGRILNSRIEIVGFGGPNPFFGGEIALRYRKRPQVRRSPMFYETTGFSEGDFNLTFPSSILPDTLLNSLPIRPDSLRVSFSTVKTDTTDAWGKIRLLGKEFDVLREKSVIISNNKIEIKIPIIGWFDVSTIFGGMGGNPDGGPNFGADTTIIYNYQTNTRKDVLVSIEVDNDNNVVLVDYADVNNTISTYDYSLSAHNLLYPNPASDKLFLENKQLKAGLYTARIVRMDGSIVSEFSIRKASEEPMFVDVHNLSNGQYSLVLYPEKGWEAVVSNFIISR